MPTLKNMEIPKPKDWQDFERLVESDAQINGLVVWLLYMEEIDNSSMG